VRDDRVREVWIHALGAKVGGGITYLKAVLPELVSQLEGSGIRVVLLLPGPVEGLEVPEGVEARMLARAASSHPRRVLFDQFVLPLWVGRRPGAVLYCSGSFAPLLKPVPTVVLLRNAIYFDDEFLRLETPRNRLLLRAQEKLILGGARGCRAEVYPSRSMRDLVERRAPGLAPTGVVDYYGVGAEFFGARGGAVRPRAAGEPASFLYVMNYTLQKNLTFLLEALIAARRERLSVRVVVTSTLENGPAACAARDRALVEEHRLVEEGYLAAVGPKYGAELVDLYGSVDACVFPSICESFGHPLVEAMVVGAPLVCADRAYARELCGEYALYVDPTRPDELVDLWRRWPEMAAAHRPAPLDELERRFSWRAHVSRLLDAVLT
jgi:glycosyltransferase involved in cell wall biosynthesis